MQYIWKLFKWENGTKSEDEDVEDGVMRKETSLVPKEGLTKTSESGTVKGRDKKPNVTKPHGGVKWN